MALKKMIERNKQLQFEGILMIKGILILFFCFQFLFYCHGKNEKEHLPIVPRDTSITTKNAFTQLFLDSSIVEKFISIDVTSDSIANRIRNFYNARNFQFAWFYEEGLTEQAKGFWNLHNRYLLIGDSTIYNREIHRQMDELLNADTSYILKKDSLILIELRLTQHFFQYVHFAYEKKLDPEKMQWHIPSRKMDAIVILDSLFAKLGKFDDWQPLNSSFHKLHDALFKYYSIQKKGGWPTIKMSNAVLKRGDKHAVITQIKQRLRISGDFLSQDSSILFTKSLENAVKKIKRSFGMKENGDINTSFIKELNVPVKVRIEQMLINLERMRWMPEQPLYYIEANIPEYRLQVHENGKNVLGMDIIAGNAVHKTVIFSGELKYIVFSPYWNVPRNIVLNEILPEMNRNENYLNGRNMEITGYSGDLPIIRQKPGASNSLGKVKFLFLNQYNIYFHDTPTKNLFSRQKRAFSHGCIRLQKPFDLAKYLLSNNEQWKEESIQSAMNAGKEKWITLEHPVPVFITYFTSWVDADGVLNFRDDIYGHDKKMAEHLFK